MRSILALAFAAALPGPGAPPTAAADDPPRVRVIALDGRVIRGDGLVPLGTRLEVRLGDSGTAIELAEVLEATVEVPALPEPRGAVGTPAIEVEVVNGDLLRGTLVRGTGETGFVVRHPALGEVEVPLEIVGAVRFPAAWAEAVDPPPLRAAAKEDRFLYLSGDRLDGTLRSVAPGEIRVRTEKGEDRTLRTDALLGFALVPLPRKPDEGVRVQAVLADGTRIGGASVSGDAKTWVLGKCVDGKDRSFPASALAGLAVRGGAGTVLSDLGEPKVEVRAYWGDDPPVLPLRPILDRAFTLDPGSPPPIRLGGRTWLRGVSMFSGTTATFDIAGKGFRSFAAAVGVDDSGPRGRVEFEVLLDGSSAWRSGVVGTVPLGGEPTAVPPIDVSSAKSLSLVVHAGPGDDVQDFADWVRPVLR